MASITTILGTDSVSSSRIVLNNNFAALNQELADIAGVLNPTNQTLTLTGLVTGGLLKIKNTSNVETFKVNESDAVVNLPITFNQDVHIGKGLTHSVYFHATALPAAGQFNYSIYVLDGNTIDPAGTIPVVLNEGVQGQEITLIADGNVTLLVDNIAGTSSLVISDDGSLTLRYVENKVKWYIVSSHNCTIA